MAKAVCTQTEPEKCLILGTEIIGIDGFSKRTGVIEQVTDYSHSVLGRFIQVWVRWDDNNALEPFFPRQFMKYEGHSAIGVYYL